MSSVGSPALSSGVLTPGSRVCFDGALWQLEALVGTCARLRGADGTLAVIGVVQLVNAAGYRLVGPDGVVEALPPVNAAMVFVPDAERERVAAYAGKLRMMEFGHPLGVTGAGSAGPDARFDPASTTLSDRVQLMAGLLGLGESTLWRDLAKLRADGVAGLVRKPLLGSVGPTAGVDPRYVEALIGVLDELVAESNPTGQRIRRLVHARLVEVHGDGVVSEPGKSRFYELLAEVGRGRFVFGAAKNRRSVANRPKGAYGRWPATRPMELVIFDSTPLDVFAMDEPSGRWVPLELSVAMDAFSRRIVALRLTPRGPNRVDASLILCDIVRGRPPIDLGPTLAWRYAGLPEEIVVVLSEIGAAADHRAMLPETVVPDHARIYLSEAFRGACARLQISLAPARVLCPTDKADLERFFRTVRESLLVSLPGYKGPDVFSRGAEVESGAYYFVHELEAILWVWVERHYHERDHDGLYLPAAPHVPVSPNKMHDEGVARTGRIRVPSRPDLVYDLLPVKRCTIQHYGVELDGLRYNGTGLDPYRDRARASRPRASREARQWAISYDPRDLSAVFFCDPATYEWHRLSWVGAPELERPFSANTLAYAKSLLVERAGRGPNHELLTVSLNGLLDRLDRRQALNPKEAKLAIRNGLQTDAAKRDLPSPVARPDDEDTEPAGDVEDVYAYDGDGDGEATEADGDGLYEVLR